jgi:hypothetical protein
MLSTWKNTVSPEGGASAFCPKRTRSFAASSHTEGKVLSTLGSASAGCLQNQSLSGLSQPLSWMRDGFALARRVNLRSALTSEIRHATNSGKSRRFITLFNSDDSATLTLGNQLAVVESADILSCDLARNSAGARNSAAQPK